MKRVIVVVLFVLAASGLMMAQNWSSTVDVLGAHNNQGRGCAGCHAPHSGSFGSGHGGGADAGSYALWGQDASPLYGKTIAFGDSGKYTEVLPSSITSGSTEVGGILLCLSCHDGNVTASNMMTGKSYEQTIGLLTNTAYGTQPIPTLLGNDGTTAGNYTNDHPVGQLANISTTQPGLVWSGTAFSVTAGSPFAQFVANYGWPALAPGKYSNPYGVTAAGKPYVVCTTCHNQHLMNVVKVTTGPKSGLPSGNYATMFFIRAPYNPASATAGSNQTAQFCRQCHGGESNEMNGSTAVTTF